MKKAVCLIFALLISVFSVLTVSAEVVSYEYNGVKFALGSDYAVSTKEEAEASGVDGLVFFAVTEDGKHQIQCREKQSDYSKEMGSFSLLSPEDLTPAGNYIFNGNFTTAEFGTDIYLKQTSLLENSEQSVVYATVSGGKLYTFTYIGSDITRIGEFMGTVTLPIGDDEGNSNTLIIITISILILAFAVFIVALILSFIRDYRHRKMEQSENIVSNYIKIKRRKY